MYSVTLRVENQELENMCSKSEIVRAIPENGMIETRPIHDRRLSYLFKISPDIISVILNLRRENQSAQSY